MEGVSIIQVERAELGAANSRGVRQHRLEDWLQFAGRAGNDLQHLRGRRLLFQRLAEIGRALTQLVEQPRILDGDDGLGGEVLDQFDLFAGERPDLLAKDGDGADQFTILEHRYKKVGSRAGGLHQGHEAGVPLDIALLSHQVDDVDNIPGCGQPRERVKRIPAPSLGIGARRILLGGNTKRILLIEKQISELRPA